MVPFKHGRDSVYPRCLTACKSSPQHGRRAHCRRTPPDNATCNAAGEDSEEDCERTSTTNTPQPTAGAENQGTTNGVKHPRKSGSPTPFAYRIRRLKLSGEPEQSCGCSGCHQPGRPRYRGRHRYQPQGTSQQSEQQKCTRRACTARTGQPPRRLRYR